MKLHVANHKGTIIQIMYHIMYCLISYTSFVFDLYFFGLVFYARIFYLY